MYDFTISIVSGIIGSLILLLIFGGRERAFRAWLANLGNWFLRRLYIRWFIAALDGSTQALPLYYIIALTILMVTMTMSATYGIIAAMVDTKSPDAIAARAAFTMEQLEAERQHVYGLAVLLEQALRWGGIVAITLAMGWLMIAYSKTRLMIEVMQSIRRVQALATKAELKPLFAAESRVRDEESLKEFNGVLARLAEQYGVRVRLPLDLWKDDKTSEST